MALEIGQRGAGGKGVQWRERASCPPRRQTNVVGRSQQEADETEPRPGPFIP